MAEVFFIATIIVSIILVATLSFFLAYNVVGRREQERMIGKLIHGLAKIRVGVEKEVQRKRRPEEIREERKRKEQKRAED